MKQSQSQITQNQMKPIELTLYRWAGSFGPFKVKIPCGECSLTEAIIQDVLTQEFTDIPIQFTIKDWLSHWWQPLKRGAWHAPIVLVDNHVVSQGVALNRGVLTQALITAYAKRQPITDNHLFGKSNCPYCQQAKDWFKQHNITVDYHDVIAKPAALYEMLARVKPIIGPKTPVTLPQIWLDGKYIGGYDQLKLISQTRRNKQC